MKRTDALVVGGGQAGLAMSRWLTHRGVDHVVLERGRIAERWRSERWNSLRLLTPNWQSRLPGHCYRGPDPDGYMSMPEVISYLESFARSFDPPVISGTAVTSVEPEGDGLRVETDTGAWHARNVVLATGYSHHPVVPPLSARLPRDIVQVVPSRYRHPGELPPGGVLVVGASATGVQLADEIHASGRPVTLAVGRHLRLPRRYRGKDILWWLDAMGAFDEGPGEVADLASSRAQPSFQLVGRPDHASLDLMTLRLRGVRIVGRLEAVDGTRLFSRDDLVATTVAADAKLATLTRRIDEFARRAGLDAAVGPPEPVEPYWPVFFDAPTTVSLLEPRVATVVWATGFRPDWSFLRVPVLDDRGAIRHVGGRTPWPGLFVLGLPFLRRRKSAFIDGVGDDARVLADEIARGLGVSPVRIGREPAAALECQS